MVKGVSRRVVVVQPEANSLFEQAIFFVRDYNAPRGDVLREACRIANGYLPPRTPRLRRRRVSFGALLLAFLAGGGLVGGVMAAVLLL